jgi:methyl-accepting chemotaxis protein WspA
VKITLKRKFLGLAALAAALPVVVILGLVVQFKRSVAARTEVELKAMGRANITQITRDVYNLCDLANELAQSKVNHNLETATDLLSRRGGLRTGGDAIAWTAVDQVTEQRQTIELPRLLAGGTWLGQNRNLAASTPFVDEVKHLAGGTTTVFQRMNERGDMLRVATNIADAQGNRAIGTYIAAIEADGTPNAVVSAVLAGQVYRGLAYILGHPYVTAYAPLRSGGRVIGMLYVGEEIGALSSLRRAITSTKVGENGYVAIIGCKGPNRGRYAVSKDARRDGDSIWEARDASGSLLIQRMVERGLKAPKGEIFYEEYGWKNPDEDKARTKIAALVYFEPWDWLINAGTYEDDYFAAVNTVNAAIGSLTTRMVLAGIAALALALALAVVLGGRLVRPLGVTAEVAKRIAEGNLLEARKVLALFGNGNGKPHTGHHWIEDADEAMELVESFRTMTGQLDSLIGQVQRSGIQVNASALQIAASARELEATVAEQAASTREVTATTKEISATSTDLMHTMQGVSGAIVQAGGKAESGQTDLERMRTSMHQLAQATTAISSKLGVISERANKISSVVATINKISDQTGLLALNAAIEAEKAGEHGRGFSVVAREISRLADQTAVSTHDIEGVVHEMQSSVSSGVMEMDRFSEEVRRRAEEVGTVGQQLAEIIEQVRVLAPQVEAVSEGMNAQTLGAQQISEAMIQLSQAAEQTKGSLQEFKQATEQLRGAVQGLQSEVATFRISA